MAKLGRRRERTKMVESRARGGGREDMYMEALLYMYRVRWMWEGESYLNLDDRSSTIVYPIIILVRAASINATTWKAISPSSKPLTEPVLSGLFLQIACPRWL
jgi:hypothetical protein